MKKNQINSGIEFNLVNETATRTSIAVDNIINTAARILIVMLLTLGSVFTFTTMMGVQISELPIYLLIGLLSVLLPLLYKQFKKHWLITIIFLGIAIVSALILFSPFITGSKAIYDNCINSIYNAMYWTAPDPIIKWNESYLFNTTYCIAILSVIIATLASYFISAKTNFVGVFLATFPLFEIGAAFGCAPSHFPFALMLAGWAAALVLHIANRQKVVIKHKNGDKQKKEKKFTYKDKSGKFGGSAIVMAVSFLLVFAVASGILNSSGFSRDDKTNSLRKTVKETVLNAYDLITGYDHDASLKDGKLYYYADRKVKNRHYMSLSMPDTGEATYLSGYIGSVYTGNSWTQLDESKYKEISKVTEYMKSKGYSLPTITGDMLLTYAYDNPLKTGEFSINELRRKKDYMFTNKGILYNATFYPDNDNASSSTQKNKYSYSSYYQLKDMAKIPYTTLYTTTSFKNQWKTYTEFVQKYYTLLPSGIEDVTRLAQQFSGDNIYALCDSVREFLAQNTTYSDYVQKLPDNQEFASFFIYKEQKGYSAHYATAAAVMLRALGVPTRYVEGFYIDKNQVKAGAQNANGTKQIEVTDANYHAWIEVYDSTLGWVPVDATPGFYSGKMEAFMQKAKNETKKEINKQKEDQNKDKQSGKEDLSTNNKEQTDDQNTPSAIQSEEPDFGEAWDKEEKDKKTESFKLFWYYIPLGLVLIAIISLAVLIIRRKKALRKRERIFNSSDYKAQVILAVQLLQKMLKFKHLDLKEAFSYEKFKQIVCENLSPDEKTLEDVFEIYEIAQFSKIYVDESKAQIVLDFLDEFGYSLYKDETLFKKLKFKFINNLM